MASGSTPGKMAASMRENTKTIKNMGLAFIFGPTDASTRATGSRVSSTAWAYTLFQQVVDLNVGCGKRARGWNGLMPSSNSKSKKASWTLDLTSASKRVL